MFLEDIKLEPKYTFYEIVTNSLRSYLYSYPI